MRILSLAAVLLTLSIAGCATVPIGVPNISQNDALKLVDGYRLLQAGIIGYEALPGCASSNVGTVAGIAVCKSKSAVDNFKTLDKVGAPSAHTLYQVATDPASQPNITLSAAYAALSSTYKAIKAAFAPDGIQTSAPDPVQQ